MANKLTQHSAGALVEAGQDKLRENKPSEAAALFEQALALDAGSTFILHLLGEAQLALNRPADAEQTYSRAILLDANNAMLQRGRGDALVQLGRDPDAVGAYELALSVTGALSAMFRAEADRLQKMGQAGAAASAAPKVQALEKDMAALLLRRGEALLRLGKNQELAGNYRMLVSLDPIAENFHRLGHALGLTGQHSEALASYDRAIALKPDYAEVHINRGVALIARRQFGEAVQALDRAIALLAQATESLQATHATAHVNRGIALTALMRRDEALASYNQAIAILPTAIEAFKGRGLLFADLHRFDEALADHDRAIALEAEQGTKPFSQSVFNKALALLTLGRLEEGWPLFEQRAEKALLANWKKLSPVLPQWTGPQPLAGKRLFLYEEQGIGDTIQFSRYALMAEHAGAQVTLAAAPKLHTLLATLSPAIRIVPEGARPDCDLHCPLMSLPLAFGTRLENIPGNTPYLSVAQKKVTSWKTRLEALPGLKVGLAWAGDSRHGRDALRSVPLQAISDILTVPGASFVSLQFGPRAADVAAHPEFGILDASADLPGLDDMGACMEALDLVITVDSAPAHLAGALARPTWVLLPFCSDWRWLLQRPDSPWYPTLRLFRQDVGEAWPAVAARMAGALRQLIEAKTTS